MSAPVAYVYPAESIVATSGDLAALPVVASGAIAYIQSRKCRARFAAGQALATSNTVFAGNGGQWNRLPTADPSWALQATWVISTTGSDDNSGVDSTHALATFDEVSQRINRNVQPVALQQSTTVTWIGANSAPADVTEDIYFDVVLALSTITFIVRSDPSTWTQLYSGTLGAGTLALSPAAQQPNTLVNTAGGFDWATSGPAGSSLINHRIRMTSGAGNGATGWLDKRVSASTATSKVFQLPIFTAPTSFGATEFNPASGDTFVVESLPGCLGFDIRVERLGNGTPSTQAAGFFDSFYIGINVASTPNASACFFKGVSLNLQFGITRCRCQLNSFSGFGSTSILIIANSLLLPLGGQTPTLKNCILQGGGQTGGAGCNLAFGRGTATSALFIDPIFRGMSGSLEISADALGYFAVFDATGDAVMFRPSNIPCMLFDESSVIWGNNNGGVGIDFQVQARFAWSTALRPIITGATGDLRIGGQVLAWNKSPVWDASKGIFVGPYGSPAVSSVYLTAQGAAIGATNLYTSNPARGMYRVNVVIENTVNGNAGDTATVTIGWRDIRGVQSAAVISAAPVSGGVAASGSIRIRTNGANNVTYALSFPTKTGAPQINLAIVIEPVQGVGV